jgi:lipopolysaccharide/colanic/teichoic acid biosynthesis glycosyltransferase
MTSGNSAENVARNPVVQRSSRAGDTLVVELAHPTRIRATAVSELFASIKHTCRVVDNSALLNDVRRINEFLLTLHQILPLNALYVARAETIGQRKKRFQGRFGPRLFWLPYSLDFLIHRVVPKLPFVRRAYFSWTRGRKRAISLTEILGRFAYCGFAIEEFSDAGDATVFRVRKTGHPRTDAPTYGPVATIPRVGKDGQMVSVYKVRTMHPFAEYIQDYVYERNSVAAGGKFNNDFRITSWGRLLRRLWIDELPMIVNVLRGDLKLVGVRPLSVHYFGLYPSDLQTARTRYKPGLIPPYYVDLPKTLDEIFASEAVYLEAYEKAPFRTDLRYGAKAMYNILVRRKRSA